MPAPEEDDRRCDEPPNSERDDDVLVVRVRGVEQIMGREEVDVVQHYKERTAPTPEEDEGRDDRVGARGVRLRPMETGARFQPSSGENRTSR